MTTVSNAKRPWRESFVSHESLIGDKPVEQLICWTLMGLRQNGPDDVWYQLDKFETAEQAKDAAGDSKYVERGFAQFDVMPYYRVECARHVETNNASDHVSQTPA